MEEETSPNVPTAECHNFYEWSCEFFAKPIMNQREDEEELGPQFAEKLWKKQRNESIVTECETLKKSNSILSTVVTSAFKSFDFC